MAKNTRETKAATRGTPAPAPSKRKSMKMEADELTEKIKACVKEALEEQADEKEGEEPAEETAVEAAPADIAAIIEQAMDVVAEKRKSRKEEGEEVGDITSEEIMEAVGELLDAAGADEEAKEDEDAGDEEAKGAGHTGGEHKRQKGATRPKQTKTARQGAAPVQRKYSSLFLSRPAPAAAAKKKVPPMVQLARAIKCLDVFGRNDPERAAFYARKHYDDTDMEHEFKALSATNPVNGGFLIPEVYTDEIIELLYSKTVVKGLGARTIPLETGNLNMPRMTAGTRARWGGEARKIATTQPKFGNLRLSAKRLEAIVPQTRELIMSTRYSADEIFAADLSRRMELGLDWGALYGSGGEFQPTGIAHTDGIAVVDAKKLDKQYADTTGKVTADFPVYIKSLVMSKNVDDQSLGWAFNSFMEGYLMNLKTATGDYLYREEMAAGKFLGAPYAISNQIPWSQDGLTDIFFGNWADLLIGDQMGLETFTTLEGCWTDEDGVQHNAFEENLTGTRALMYDDIGVRHVESFVHVKNVKAF